MGSLSFASPLILAALAALPAIWLLLRATPPPPQRQRFPGFILLRDLQSKEETPDKTPWWLLLLRLLIAAAVILGLAGPVLNAPEATGAKGPLVLVVDDGWPSAAGWRLRLNAINKAAAEIEKEKRPAYILTTAPTEQPQTLTPLTAETLRDAARSLAPKSLYTDYQDALSMLNDLSGRLAGARAEIRWLSDGIAGPGDSAFASELRRLGELTVYGEAPAQFVFLRPTGARPLDLALERSDASVDYAGAAVALTEDRRELGRVGVELGAGEKSQPLEFNLPLALENDVAMVRIDAAPSAGAVRLIDARARRTLVGFVAGAKTTATPLLSGENYVRQALTPFATFVEDEIGELVSARVSIIVMNDIGRLRESDLAALDQYIEEGGVVLRFSGENLAEAAQDEEPELLPAPLRGGGRAFGGALSWETPQPIGAFSADGPFHDLEPPGDVFVRRQILASPGGATSAATWASLIDGTPLVTGVRRGAGALVLFHVTATPEWSDLPVSGVFVEMLRKIAHLSTLGEAVEDGDDVTRFPPLQVLDGFGALGKAPATLSGATLAEIETGPSVATPPGFYGSPGAAVAVNAVGTDDQFKPLSIDGVALAPYSADAPRRFAPALFALALIALLVDAFASLKLGGKLRRAPVAATLVAIAVNFAAVDHSVAQTRPLDPPIDDRTSAAALQTRFAFVQTGDPAIDRVSEAGLANLSRELTRRTALEPAAPTAIDPETDDLSVFPIIYWPMSGDAAPPSELALANIETFMRFGGLVIFDTRDDERALAGVDTAERMALQSILRNIDTPPLIPLPESHVLTRSFYLLPDLPGRFYNNPVWVQASGEANDAVTPLIIGGRDWAGAWAADDFGRYMLPMAAGGDRGRELSLRAGINIAMVALTGNYKSDQVHMPILLRRLDR